MLWTLAHKVSVALLAILVCMMAATCSFAYWKLEDFLSSMVRSRYGVIVEAIKSGIEDRSALGIPLFQQHSIQEQLERYKGEDVQILDIEVFNAEGDILYNSDRGAIGARVPKGWLAMLTEQNWTYADGGEDEGQVVGAPIVGAFDQPIGGVVLRYPATYVEDRLGAVIAKLGADMAILIVAFGGVAVIGSIFLLRGIRLRLLAMEASLSDLIDRADGVVPSQPDSQDHSFEGCFHGFEWRTREVVVHLKSALDDVERLDRLA